MVRIYGAGEVPDVPAAVTGLTVEMDRLSATLTWKNPAADWVKTRILRKEGSAPTGPRDGTVVYEGTGESLTQEGLTDGTAYYWAAYPLNLIGKAGPGAGVSGTARSIDPADWADCAAENIRAGVTVRNEYTGEDVTGTLDYLFLNKTDQVLLFFTVATIGDSIVEPHYAWWKYNGSTWVLKGDAVGASPSLIPKFSELDGKTWRAINILEATLGSVLVKYPAADGVEIVDGTEISVSGTDGFQVVWSTETNGAIMGGAMKIIQFQEVVRE